MSASAFSRFFGRLPNEEIRRYFFICSSLSLVRRSDGVCVIASSVRFLSGLAICERPQRFCWVRYRQFLHFARPKAGLFTLSRVSTVALYRFDSPFVRMKIGADWALNFELPWHPSCSCVNTGGRLFRGSHEYRAKTVTNLYLLVSLRRPRCRHDRRKRRPGG